MLDIRVERCFLLVGLANPPVNALSLLLRRELYDAITRTACGSGIEAVIVYGTGRCFCAGGDLRELGSPANHATPRLSIDVLPAVEACGKPVIAALHGAAVGGGFELALACHYRIATENTRLSLPEVQHGIIPLSGTQRLPRVWGVHRALDLMLNSRELNAGAFADSAVFDQIVTDGDVLTAAIEFAHALVERKLTAAQHAAHLIRNRPHLEADPQKALIDSAVLCSNLVGAQRAVFAAVRAGVEAGDFDAGLATAQHLFNALAGTLGR